MELSCPPPKTGNWRPQQLLDYTGLSSIQFFNSPPFSKLSKLGHTWYPLHELWGAMPRHWSPRVSHQSRPIKQRISLGVANILQMCPCPYSQLTCNKCYQYVWIDIYIKEIMNDFTCGEEISKLAV